MVKKITGILFLMLVVISGVQGQYSQYMVNGLVINPAYAGSRDIFSLSGSYKQVWTALPGAPSYQQISTHMPLKNDRIGLGMVLGNNKEGASQTMYGSFDYAYRIHFEKSVLSLGLRATAEYKKENFDGLHYDPADPVFVNNSVFQPNFGFGIYYYNSRMFAGLSMPRMITYGMTDSSFTENLTSYNPNDYHYLATAGFLAGKGKLKWKPTVLFQYFGFQKDYSVDLNSFFILFDDKVWLGASYRTGGKTIADQVVGLIEVKITEQLMIGYAYDYTMGPYSSMLSGSHEIYIRFEPVHTIKAINPRYF